MPSEVVNDQEIKDSIDFLENYPEPSHNISFKISYFLGQYFFFSNKDKSSKYLSKSLLLLDRYPEILHFSRRSIENKIKLLNGVKADFDFGPEKQFVLNKLKTNIVTIKEIEKIPVDPIDIFENPFSQRTLTEIQHLITNGNLEKAQKEMESLKEMLIIKKSSGTVDAKLTFFVEKEAIFLSFYYKTEEFKKSGTLPKGFLKQLSNMIVKISLTENLQLSSLIHISLLHFDDTQKISTYLNDFSEYFKSLKTAASVSVKQQIAFVQALFPAKEGLAVNMDVLIASAFHFFERLSNFEIPKSSTVTRVLIEAKVNAVFLIAVKQALSQILRQLVDSCYNQGSENELVEYILMVRPDILKVCKERRSEIKLSFTAIRNETALVIDEIIDQIHAINDQLSEKRDLDLLFFRRKVDFPIALLEERLVAIGNFKDKWMASTDKELLYTEFKTLFNDVEILRMSLKIAEKGKIVESLAVLQYVKNIDYGLATKIAKQEVERHNERAWSYIWKISLLEILAYVYGELKREEQLKQITFMMRKVSSHQLLKKNKLRKHFKVVNFFNLVDELIK